MEKIGERIRRLRRARGWGQIELGEVAGVHQSTISDMESKESDFKLSHLLGVCKALEISPAMLLFGSDEATWPFKRVSQEKFLALDAGQRDYVEGRLEEILSNPPPPTPRPTTIKLGIRKTLRKIDKRGTGT